MSARPGTPCDAFLRAAGQSFMKTRTTKNSDVLLHGRKHSNATPLWCSLLLTISGKISGPLYAYMCRYMYRVVLFVLQVFVFVLPHHPDLIMVKKFQVQTSSKKIHQSLLEVCIENRVHTWCHVQSQWLAHLSGCFSTTIFFLYSKPFYSMLYRSWTTCVPLMENVMYRAFKTRSNFFSIFLLYAIYTHLKTEKIVGII